MWLNEINDLLLKSIETTVSYFTNGSKRLHVVYLLSSLMLAFYVFKQAKVKYSFFKYIFSKHVWTGKSAVVDYSFIFFNSILKVALIGPYLVSGLYIAFYCSDYLTMYFGIPEHFLSSSQTLVLFTIAITITQDFFSYVVHYLMHKVSFLWEFHKIHHSATRLNPITQYRIHPIELIINNIKGVFVFGVLTGIFDYISNSAVKPIEFISVNILSFIFLFWGSNLRHSHVKLKYFTFLEKIFISPFQHQIHHSSNPAHFNKNMGAKLAIWDWMFNTILLSKSITNLKFGLGKSENKIYDSFAKNLYQPFLQIMKRIIS